MRVPIRSLCALMTLSFALSALGGQPCNEMVYEDRNQVDYGPIGLRQLHGKAVDRDGVAVPGVCVGLFSEADHRLITATETRAKGDFRLRDVPKGNYRLVAKYEAFGTANARVFVGRGAAGVILKMRTAGTDTTSYIEPK